MPALGTVWSTGRGTTLNTELLACDAVNTPVAGDLVGKIGAGGAIQFVPTDPTTATNIFGICVNDAHPKLNNPGFGAAANGEPATAHFGGRGSRAATTAPARQRFIAPINKEDRILMTPTTDAGVAGTAYGINRNGAGDYSLDISDTLNPVARIEGYYGPDVAAGAAIRRVWVRLLTVPV